MEGLENLEKRVSRLEKKQESYEEKINQILIGIAKIEQILQSKDKEEAMQVELDSQKIDAIEQRVSKLEANQKWLVTSIIGEVLAIIFGIIMAYIQKGM